MSKAKKTEEEILEPTQKEGTEQTGLTEEELLDQELSKFFGFEEQQEEEAQNSEDDDSSTEDNSEALTGQQNTNDETSEEEQIAPLDERLDAFEEKYKPRDPQDENTPKAQLKQFQEKLSAEYTQLNNTDILTGLPKSGVFQKDGKSIYEMDHKEVNDYIVNLQDEGRAFDAAQVQTNYLKAVDSASRYQAAINNYQQNYKQYENLAQYVEWQDVKDEVWKQLPELTQSDFDKIGAYIDQQTANDPLYAAAITNKVGKIKKGVEALDKLGILKRLRESTSKAQIKKPAAPDSSAGSKRVKRVETGNSTYRPEQIKSIKDLGKLKENELDAMLEEEMERMFRGG